MRTKKVLFALLAVLLAVSSFPSYSKTKAAKPIKCEDGFTCLKVKRGQSWQSLFPDEDMRGIVMRVNRRNGQLYSGLIIRIPNDIETGDLLDYSPFPRQIDSPQEKLVVVDLNLHAWGAYDWDGELVKWGPATGGAGWCPDIDRSCRTKAGTFRVYSLGSSNCVSSKFPIPDGGAPMPYCMFFHGGQALHGSPGGVIPGNVSHGCVRLFVQDAEWLRYDFVDPPITENDYRGTKIIVVPYGSKS
ncbi:MAG: enhanced entry protein EnhA [uncultured bacterium]|nr:MAG: enhanced entry protein EnhA [uncultured bacterium]